MSDLNIDEFYADAALTLTNLYAVFPRPVTIFAEDICGPDEPDEYGVHSNRYLACFSTLLWLGEEGYIRYADTIRQDAVDQAVLTGRCFAALMSPAPQHEQTGSEEDLPPSVAIRQRSIVHALEVAVKSKSSPAIQAAFSPLLERMAR